MGEESSYPNDVKPGVVVRCRIWPLRAKSVGDEKRFPTLSLYFFRGAYDSEFLEIILIIDRHGEFESFRASARLNT